jgi:hypothetical protein
LKDLFTLKSKVRAVTDGGEGITDTGDLLQGDGVILSNSDNNDQQAQQRGGGGGESEEGEGEGSERKTLSVAFRSKGLVGVFDHDAVDTSSSNQSTAEREMDERAKAVARKAGEALRRSASEVREKQQQAARGYGGSAAAFGRGGEGGGGGGGGGASGLLAQIRRREQQTQNPSFSAAPAGMGGGREEEDDNAASRLMRRMKDFIVRKGGGERESFAGGPTTHELLAEFKEVKDGDEAAVFKQMLKAIAKKEGGKWVLKPS